MELLGFIFFLILITLLENRLPPPSKRVRKYTDSSFYFSPSTRSEPLGKELEDILSTTVRPTPNGMYMSAVSKREYLSSPHWKSLQEERKLICNGTCEASSCTNPSTELHHTHYSNLGTDNITDVVYLCRPCHQTIHDKLGYNRATHYPINQE